MKRAVLVNGVPASGKSTVARAVSTANSWPLLTLDTVKEAFFAHLGTGDRDYNRLLGKASYQAMFALIGDFPENSTTVIDAWFGFQPLEVLLHHITLRRHWPDSSKYGAMRRRTSSWSAVHGTLATRHTGHLGADYIPELVELAGTRQPLGRFPRLEIDTAKPLNAAALPTGSTGHLAA